MYLVNEISIKKTSTFNGELKKVSNNNKVISNQNKQYFIACGFVGNRWHWGWERMGIGRGREKECDQVYYKLQNRHLTFT